MSEGGRPAERPGVSPSPADVDREITCPPVAVEIMQPIGGNRELPYVCPNCGRASWHPRDAAERYCGYCHDWA